MGINFFVLKFILSIYSDRNILSIVEKNIFLM